MAEEQEADDVAAGEFRKKKKKKRTFAQQEEKFEDFFEVKEVVLGRGAFSTVRPCIQKSTGARYAAKIVVKHPDVNSNTKREIEILSLISRQSVHPHILQMIAHYESPQQYHLVMEMAEGGALFHQIRDAHTFTESEARQVMRQLVSAVAYLHNLGIAHRDLKPQNVLCGQANSLLPVKISDFGLGTQNSATKSPYCRSPVGTAEFMAPEVVTVYLEPNHTYGKGCDIWSLGIILAIMFTGESPFVSRCQRPDCQWEDKGCEQCTEQLLDSIQADDPDFTTDAWRLISNSAVDLVARMLTKDAALRPTAEQIMKEPWIMDDGLLRTPLASPAAFRRSLSQLNLLAITATRQGSQVLSRSASFSENLAELSLGEMSPYAEPFILKEPQLNLIRRRQQTQAESVAAALGLGLENVVSPTGAIGV